MTGLRFWKTASIGNHFVLVHTEDIAPLGDPDKLLPEIAISTGRHRFGVGSDGLLAIAPGDPIRLRMFNPDGTEDFCGNGLRCATLHAYKEGWAKDEMRIDHLGRLVETSINSEGVITTKLGAASYRGADIPAMFDEGFDRIIDGVIQGSVLTTGSTHTVIPVDQLPESPDFELISERIEHLPEFPERTSVIWSRAASRDKIEIRIWERGVGETFGCGTGSSAAAIDFMRRRGSGGTVEVVNKGGSVFVSARNWDDVVSVTGTAKELFTGRLT